MDNENNGNKESNGRSWIFWSLILGMPLIFWLFSKTQNPADTIQKAPQAGNPMWLNLLYITFGIAVLFVILHFAAKFQRKSFGGKNNMKTYKEGMPNKVTFDDVAGVDEAKAELTEVVEFLQHNENFGRLGGRAPKGALLVGPPGTGKTLLARALAGEAGASFLYMSGSDFVEMFVGVGAARVRELFARARRKLPCIIFIDEIDAVAKHRGAGIGQNHNENEQTLNALLVEMDGFEPNSGLFVIVATNRPDVLDPALLRPGRFDRQIVVSRPDIRGREAILRVHTRNKVLAPDLDLRIIARATPGATGADLENLANEAAIGAERQSKEAIEAADFEEAQEKMLMGRERPMIMSDSEKRVVAVHEAGHAFVGVARDTMDPLYKVSIIPRSHGSLGVTLYLPEKDKLLMSKKDAEDQIAMLLGGRIAEEVLLGPDSITDGARNDLERATELADNMVTKWGMDEEIGPVAFGGAGGNPFLGRSLALSEGTSQQMRYKIEERMTARVRRHYDDVKALIAGSKEKINRLVEALLEREELSGEEVRKILEE